MNVGFPVLCAITAGNLPSENLPLSWLMIRDVFLFSGAMAGLGTPWSGLSKPWLVGEEALARDRSGTAHGPVVGFGLFTAGLPLQWF